MQQRVAASLLRGWLCLSSVLAGCWLAALLCWNVVGRLRDDVVSSALKSGRAGLGRLEGASLQAQGAAAAPSAWLRWSEAVDDLRGRVHMQPRLDEPSDGLKLAGTIREKRLLVEAVPTAAEATAPPASEPLAIHTRRYRVGQSRQRNNEMPPLHDLTMVLEGTPTEAPERSQQIWSPTPSHRPDPPGSGHPEWKP